MNVNKLVIIADSGTVNLGKYTFPKIGALAAKVSDVLLTQLEK